MLYEAVGGSNLNLSCLYVRRFNIFRRFIWLFTGADFTFCLPDAMAFGFVLAFVFVSRSCVRVNQLAVNMKPSLRRSCHMLR